MKTQKNRRKTTKEFIAESIFRHGKLYNYDLVEYKTALDKVDIKCNKCHFIFPTLPLNHTRINGSGCPKCNKPGVIDLKFLKDNKLGLKQGILYSIKFTSKSDNEIFYKIGITSTSLKTRFNAKEYNVYDIELLDTYNGTMIDCYLKEDKIKEKNIAYRYNPRNKFGGYSECYIKQIEI